MYKIFFFFFVTINFVFVTSASDSPQLKNIDTQSQGSTKFGTFLEALGLSIVGLAVHTKQCDKYCDLQEAEGSGKFSYDICSSDYSDESNIFRKLATSPLTGVKCMLYCNRLDFFRNSVHHKNFLDEFLNHFDAPNSSDDQDNMAIPMLAAVMSVAPGDNIRNSVLHRYLTYHKYSTTRYTNKNINLPERLIKVLKKLKDYHCKDLADKNITGIIIDPRDEVGCNK